MSESHRKLGYPKAIYFPSRLIPSFIQKQKPKNISVSIIESVLCLYSVNNSTVMWAFAVAKYLMKCLGKM